MTDKTLNFNVFARAKAEGFGVVASQTEKLKGGLGKLAAVAGGLFAANKLAGFFADSVTEARESQKVNAQTAAVIKSTGGAAHVTAKQFGDLATAISNKTGIDDEQIQASENMLATFTGVRNEVGKGNDIFNQATQTITDMSAALGQDANSSAIQLGKALNDPIKGVTALQRVGVTFTQSQKDQIKTLVASGNTLGAQKIILGELSKEFGGSAAAQATAADKAKVAWGNVKEAVGGVLIPVLDKLATFLTGKVLPALTVVVAWVQAHWPAVQRVIVSAWNNAIRPALTALADFFTQRVVPAVRAVVDWVVQHWPQIQAVFVAVWNQIRPVLDSLGTMLKTLWQQVMMPIVAWVQAHWSQISTVAKIVFVAVAIAAKVLLVAIKLAFDGITLTIKATVAVIRWMDGAVRAVWNSVKAAVTATKNWIVDRFNDVISFFKGIPGKIAGAAVHLWDSYRNASAAAKKWVVDRFTDVVNFVKGMPGKIASAARGMWDGITAAFKGAVNTIIDGWNSIQFRIPGFKVGPAHFGGFTLGLPDIPHLAKGGITSGPTLAVVGDNPGGREAIVPLPRNGSLGTGLALTVNVAGSVLSEQDLLVAIRHGLRASGQWGNVQKALGA